jgi:hypothetical protein
VVQKLPAVWFFHKNHVGAYEGIGSEFTRFALISTSPYFRGELAVCYLDDPDKVAEEKLRAKVGIILQQEPPNLLTGFLLDKTWEGEAVVTSFHGPWGNALARVSEMEEWTAARGLKADGPAWIIYRGNPAKPDSMEAEIRLPLGR